MTMGWTKRVTRVSGTVFWVEVEPLAAHCYTDLEMEIEDELDLTIDISTETETEDGWLRYEATRAPHP